MGSLKNLLFCNFLQAFFHSTWHSEQAGINREGHVLSFQNNASQAIFLWTTIMFVVLYRQVSRPSQKSIFREDSHLLQLYE